MEIERKFLLEDTLILKILSQHKIKIFRSSIKQFYTSISKLNEVRYRQNEDEYLLTNKTGAGIVRDELEVLITKNEYKKAQKNRISSIIKKQRYVFEINGIKHFLDIYDGNLAPLVILEVEFDSVKDAFGFKFNEIFNSLKFKEVTKDDRYKNKFLSLFGNPDICFDADKAIKILSKNLSVKPHFPAYINAYDGFRVLLSKIYLDIKKSYNEFISLGDEESLHDFRVGLRKSRSILKLAKKLYDKDICTTFCDGLKNIANETNQKRDLDVFIKYLKSIEGSEELIQKLVFINKKQEYAIKEFLQNEQNLIFFKDYEIFLDDSAGFYAVQDNKSILKKFVAQILREQIVRLEKYLKSLNDDSLNDEFHEIRIEFKKLRYLFDYFSDMFDIAILKKCTKKIRSMQELFGDLQDRDIWLDIVNAYESTLKNQSEIYDFITALDTDIARQIFEIRNKILDKREKLIPTLRSVSKALKVYY